MGQYFGREARKWALKKLCCVHFAPIPRPSGVSLESPALENIRQVPGNRAEVDQNQDALNAVLATLSVLKCSGAIFRPRSSKVSVQKVSLYPFHIKPTPRGVSLENPWLKDFPQVPGNQAEIGENHNALTAVSATLSVLKWSGAIFWPESSKPSARSFSFCQFFSKPRPSGVSLESPGMENIRQVPRNRAKPGQTHDAGKAVSAILLVLKWSWAIFRPKSLKPSVRSLYLCPFLCKPRPAGVSLESLGLENTPKLREIEPKMPKITMRVRRSWLLF